MERIGDVDPGELHAVPRLGLDRIDKIAGPREDDALCRNDPLVDAGLRHVPHYAMLRRAVWVELRGESAHHEVDVAQPDCRS